MAQSAPSTASIQSRVILWTSIRSCSSVFERSIRELQGVKCLYEPFQYAYFHGCGTLRQKGYTNIKLEAATYEVAEQSLLAEYEGCDYLFAKNQAVYVPRENFSKLTEGGFVDFNHTFLIRNPRKAIPSQWKACVRSNYDFPTHETAGVQGYSKLYELLEFIQNTGRDVIVIDAADLMKNPEYIMKLYCDRTGLPYDKQMLTWTPGEVKDWTSIQDNSEHWHWNAMYSSGFSTLAPDRNIPPSLPKEYIDEVIEECMPYYDAMYKYRVKLP